MSCSICGAKGHTKARCLKVNGINLNWKGFTSFSAFKRAQEHLVPKHFRSRKGKQRVGHCQGWYALSSERGVHYIGLVGEWRTKKQRKGGLAGQSTNTFYRRWISHDSKGGFERMAKTVHGRKKLFRMGNCSGKRGVTFMSLQ